MVIDDADALQVAVDDDSTDILETAPFQVLGNLVAQSIADTPPMLMGRIDHCLATGEAPDVLVERAELLPYAAEGTGIGDHRRHLTLAVNHVLGCSNAADIVLGEGCHPVVIEVGEATAEGIPLLQHQ